MPDGYNPPLPGAFDFNPAAGRPYALQQELGPRPVRSPARGGSFVSGGAPPPPGFFDFDPYGSGLGDYGGGRDASAFRRQRPATDVAGPETAALQPPQPPANVQFSGRLPRGRGFRGGPDIPTVFPDAPIPIEWLWAGRAIPLPATRSRSRLELPPPSFEWEEQAEVAEERAEVAEGPAVLLSYEEFIRGVLGRRRAQRFVDEAEELYNEYQRLVEDVGLAAAFDFYLNHKH